MSINADKPQKWKADIAASVDQFNTWFLRFAPKAYRDTRVEATKTVEASLILSKDLTGLDTALLKQHPRILPTLRMSTCPPLARDRLSGLAYVTKTLIGALKEGRLPRRMPATLLGEHLQRIIDIIRQMLDTDLFPWLQNSTSPTKRERYRASTIIADRLCGAISDPIIRNAQEKRQLAYIGEYLKNNGYKQKAHPTSLRLSNMEPGTFAFRMNIVVGDALKVNIPIDVIIQPKKVRRNGIPILIEAKSAGDFTNVNKRRKEEATKVHQIHATYGPDAKFVLFLCGYFDSGYLGYEAAEGIDWIWEHRIEDLDQLGI